jgi:hypothetical protein
MNSTTTWAVKKRASRRRLSFTSPKMNVLLLSPTTRVFRSSAPEIKP